MSDVFVSYKRDDERRVGALVRALQRQGLSVWWDRGLPAGEAWREGIAAALAEARCALVVWSRASTGADAGFVRDEAARAAQRGILVPVLLDRVRPPLGFGELQAVDLTAWRGSPRDPFLHDLVAAIRAKLEGRAAPAAQGPLVRLRRRLAAGTAFSILAALGVAFALNALQLQHATCVLAWAQPWLSDACGAIGLGGRPARAERIAWAERAAGDCAALREHLRAFPSGAYRPVAEALLGARSVTSVEQWSPARRVLRLYVGRDAPPTATLAAARDAALERGRARAQAMCQEFAAAGGSRHRSAAVEAQDWLCDAVPGGRVCGFDGRALCELDERHSSEQEECRAGAPR